MLGNRFAFTETCVIIKITHTVNYSAAGNCRKISHIYILRVLSSS